VADTVSKSGALIPAGAAAALLLIGFRALVVSNYQPEVALAVFSRSGIATVVLGSILPLLPSVLPLAVGAVGIMGSPVAAYFVFLHEDEVPIVVNEKDEDSPTLDGRLLAPVVALVSCWSLLVATLVLTPTNRATAGQLLLAGAGRHHWLLVAAASLLVIALALAAFGRALLSRRRLLLGQLGVRLRRQWRVWTAVGAYLLALTPALLIAEGYSTAEEPALGALLSEMWLPPERFTLRSGETVIGYALEDTPRQTVLLTEEQRLIRYLRASQISDRAICRLGDARVLPVWRSAELQPTTVTSC
jgi:hypothetical protein